MLQKNFLMNASHLRLHRSEARIRSRREIISQLGRQVKKIREERNICIHALSVACGLPLSLLRALESEDISDLDFRSLGQISRALGIDIGSLFVEDWLLSS